ncbi:MAG: hypothetical protein AB7H43_08245 [Acidimicrobiia bacterium]
MAEVRPIKIRYPAFRRFDAARIEANNAMVGLLIGTRLSAHLLDSHAGALVLLPQIYPQVRGVDLLNRTVADAQTQISLSEAHLSTMAIPFLQSVFEDLATETARLCGLRGFAPLPSERGQGLEGTLVFLERCSRSEFSAVHRHLFTFLRHIRNQIIHGGSMSSALLDTEWSGLPADAKARWVAVARRPYQMGGDASGRIVLEAPELTAALAIGKRMAVEVSGHLGRVLLDRDWAEVVADDYDATVRPLTRRSTLVRELRSFARREYGPVQPTDASLKAAVAARGLA